MIFRIHEIIGPKGLTRELGGKIKSQIGEHWKTEIITLDFEGISVASPSFLDEAVGHIVQQLSETELGLKLKTQNEPNDFELAWNSMVKARRIRASQSEGSSI